MSVQGSVQERRMGPYSRRKRFYAVVLLGVGLTLIVSAGWRAYLHDYWYATLDLCFGFFSSVLGVATWRNKT